MSALTGLVDQGLMAPDWAEALAPVDEQVAAMGAFLREEIAAGRGYQPNGESVFRAFQRPLADVRVLIVGQDPYPNPQHPIGLSFAVRRDVWPLPPSLVNIYSELRDDLGIIPPRNGDLTAWADRGRDAPQPEPDRAARRLEQPPWPRLGADHRASDHRAGCARRPVRGDPVGLRRAQAEAVARPDPVGGVGAPVAALGVPRLLRLAALQPGQRAARSSRAAPRWTGHSRWNKVEI